MEKWGNGYKNQKRREAKPVPVEPPQLDPDTGQQHDVPYAVTEDFGSPVAEIDETPLESSLPTEISEFRQIVAEFIPRLRDRVSLLRTFVDDADFDNVRETAHWLAGSAGTVGFEAFTESSQALQAAAIAGNTADMLPAMDHIESLVRRVRMSAPITDSTSTLSHSN